MRLVLGAGGYCLENLRLGEYYGSGSWALLGGKAGRLAVEKVCVLH